MRRFRREAGWVLVMVLGLAACKRGLKSGPGEGASTAPLAPLPAQYSLVAVVPSSGNGVALDLQDNLYVVEYNRDPYNYGRILDQKIVKYSPDWNRTLAFGGMGDVDIVAHRADPDHAGGKFGGLVDVAVDYCGNIYTLEEGQQSCYNCTWQNSRVQKFDQTGAYLSQFWADATSPAAAKGVGTLTGSDSVEINRFFRGARFVETSAEGYVVVLSDGRENGNPLPPSVLVLDMTKPSDTLSGTSGIHMRAPLLFVKGSHPLGQNSTGFVFVPDRPASAGEAGGGFFGTSAGTVQWLRLDPWGRVRPYTTAASSVSGFTSTITPGGGVPYGQQLGDKPSCGGPRDFNLNITHYALAEREPPVEGHIYTGNIGAAISFVGTVGRQGPGAGEFSDPRDPRFDSRGFLYICDPGRNVVNVFRPAKPL